MTSWVIVNKATNKAVFETFKQSTADKVSKIAGYKVVPIMEWLVGINVALRN